MLIFIGRLIYIAIWIFLISNLIYPFPYPANRVANIALIALVVVHGLQALLLTATLTQQEKQHDRFKVVRLFFFGIVETLSWNKPKNNQ